MIPPEQSPNNPEQQPSSQDSQSPIPAQAPQPEITPTPQDGATAMALPLRTEAIPVTAALLRILLAFLRKMDDWVNPICLLELRTTLRKNRFFVIFLIALLVSAFILSISFLVSISDRRGSHDEIGKNLFMTFFVLQLILVNLVFPAFTCTAIISEHERKSYELLITSDISSSSIIRGKFLSAFVYIFLFLIAMSPLMIISFLFGGITIFLIVTSYLGLGLLAALVAIISLWCSVFFKHSTPAMLGGYLLSWMVSIPASISLGVFVGEYLYENDIITFFSQPWTIHHTMSFMIPLWGASMIILLPYIAAVNQLKPPSEYLKTFNVRTYFCTLCFGTVFLVSIWYYYIMSEMIAKNASSYSIRDGIYIYNFFGNICMAIILCFSACGLPMQAKVSHVNLLMEWEKRKQEKKTFGFAWLFRPGALSGATLNCILSFIIFFTIFYTTAASTNFFSMDKFRVDRDFAYPYCFMNFPLLAFIFIFFVSYLSAFLSLKFEKKGPAWVILLVLLIGVMAVLPLYPLYEISANRRYIAQPWHFSFLAPILVSIISFFNLEQLADNNMNWLLFNRIPLHVAFSVFYGSLACYFWYKTLQLNKQKTQELIEQQKKIEQMHLSASQSPP